MDHVEDQPILVELVVHLHTQLEAVEDLRHGVVSVQEEEQMLQVVALPMLHVHLLRVPIQVELNTGVHVAYPYERLLLLMEEVHDHLRIQPEDMWEVFLTDVIMVRLL